jgi:hypothetical protein
MKENRNNISRAKIKKLLVEAYPYLAEEYGVKKIGLFGSYVQGEPTEASDIDLVIELEEPLGFRFIEMTEYLEKILGKKVEVLTPEGIKGIRVGKVASAIEDSVIYV